MKRCTLFCISFGLSLMALFLTVASAQESSGTQESIGRHAGSASEAARAAARRKNALAGTWDVVLTFSDGTPVKSVLSVSAGRRAGEGTVLHASEGSLILPNPTTSEQGAWEHVGDLRFIASYAGFAVDERLEQPAGTIGFRHAITLSDDEESFVGTSVFEVRAPDGTILFSDNVQTQGTRQHPQAP